MVIDSLAHPHVFEDAHRFDAGGEPRQELLVISPVFACESTAALRRTSCLLASRAFGAALARPLFELNFRAHGNSWSIAASGMPVALFIDSGDAHRA